MTLDNLPYCYKEYPPVPEMQCEGHKKPLNWALMMPVMIIGALILLIIIYEILEKAF